MTSTSGRRIRHLVEPGYYYKVLQNFETLYAGDCVRILSSDYSGIQEDFGFVLVFPDRDSIQLDSKIHKEIIAKISSYLLKAGPFDIEVAKAESKSRVHRIQLELKQEGRKQNTAERDLVHEQVEKLGISPKEAYRRLKKSLFNK